MLDRVKWIVICLTFLSTKSWNNLRNSAFVKFFKFIEIIQLKYKDNNKMNIFLIFIILYSINEISSYALSGFKLKKNHLKHYLLNTENIDYSMTQFILRQAFKVWVKIVIFLLNLCIQTIGVLRAIILLSEEKFTPICKNMSEEICNNYLELIKKQKE